MSIGTLLAYIIVALVLVVLRYLPQDVFKKNDTDDVEYCSTEQSPFLRTRSVNFEGKETFSWNDSSNRGHVLSSEIH